MDNHNYQPILDVEVGSSAGVHPITIPKPAFLSFGLPWSLLHLVNYVLFSILLAGRSGFLTRGDQIECPRWSLFLALSSIILSLVSFSPAKPWPWFTGIHLLLCGMVVECAVTVLRLSPDKRAWEIDNWPVAYAAAGLYLTITACGLFWNGGMWYVWLEQEQKRIMWVTWGLVALGTICVGTVTFMILILLQVGGFVSWLLGFPAISVVGGAILVAPVWADVVCSMVHIGGERDWRWNVRCLAWVLLWFLK